mmetsp:Transcript_86226/g.257410  ORF Transcript_86226/g.257410 Transcript_86226/m.257410 type:complete len:246 (-) Transcript_86226:257-994(-)
MPRDARHAARVHSSTCGARLHAWEGDDSAAPCRGAWLSPSATTPGASGATPPNRSCRYPHCSRRVPASAAARRGVDRCVGGSVLIVRPRRIDCWDLALLLIHRQLTVHETDHLRGVQLAVLQGMPWKFYANASRAIVLVELPGAADDVTSYVIAKSVPHLAQRELQDTPTRMPPQRARRLIVRLEVWITEEADVLQDPFAVRQAAALQQTSIALRKPAGPHELLVQPPRHLGWQVGSAVLRLQRS